MNFEYVANISAMVFSSIAMIILMIVAVKMGGAIGRTVKFLTAGIFMAVFCHSGFELMAVMELINEEILFPVMGTLLTLGSMAFAWGGFTALDNLD